MVSDTVDNETIIVDLDTGSYYDLNRSGSAIWGSLVKGATPAEIAADLVARFEADPARAERDVDGLVARLADERLIAPLDGVTGPAPSGNGGPPESGVAAGSYESPVLNKHSDMQELLLLDPIHEVDEAGWPSRL